jgi:hypothetical protein
MTTPKTLQLGGPYRLNQVGTSLGVQLVRITALAGANRYTAVAIEFDSAGATTPADAQTFTVTNVAEDAGDDGQLPAGIETLAVDVEGRWVVAVPPAQAAAPAAVFLARVNRNISPAVYGVIEQQCDGAGIFSDLSGAIELPARNLAEIGIGPGSALADDTLVLVSSIAQAGQPPTLHYTFDHPVYARYLD